MSDLTLTLADGTRVTGRNFGAEPNAWNPAAGRGEVVFVTGMVGYPESLTDPSFAGQILVLTFPLVGNYGVPEMVEVNGVPQNFESKRVQIAGLIVSEYAAKYSHHDAAQSLGEFLQKAGVPAITDVDTRALTQKLAAGGNQLGRLDAQPAAQFTTADFYDPNKTDMVGSVSPTEPQFYQRGKKTVAILDCGMKAGILRNFLARDISVHRLPATHDLSGIEYDGLFISNGPGDPAVNTKTIATIQKALGEKKPIFGICLGHQLLALASGHTTFKLKHGHRSQNQPVREVTTGRCFVTSQNHGYAVKSAIQTGWEISFENINDGTVEGLRHKTKPFFSVQFHPEASPGPVDPSYLFDEFLGKL